MSDEGRLLRYMYAGAQVDEMLASGATRTEYRIEKPLVRMVRELARRPALRYVYIERGELKIELRAAH